MASADETVSALARSKARPPFWKALSISPSRLRWWRRAGADGSFAAYDPPENIHENHILRRSIVPGRLSKAQSDEAKAIAKTIADALDYVGVLAVELFVGQ